MEVEIMGACSISMAVKGSATREEVIKAFRERQEEDRESWLCDHEDDEGGYTGDFQTVDSVKFTDMIFEDEHEAMRYCLKHAEKWVNVVAVKVAPIESEPFWLLAGWGAE